MTSKTKYIKTYKDTKISDPMIYEIIADKDNTESTVIIDAEEKIIYNTLMKKASKASLEVAKSHIKDTLRNNEALQDKYINESIDKLDGLNL